MPANKKYGKETAMDFKKRMSKKGPAKAAADKKAKMMYGKKSGK